MRPDLAVAVDVTHATDAPGVDEKEVGSHRARLRPGDRPRLDALAEGLRAAGRDRRGRRDRAHGRRQRPRHQHRRRRDPDLALGHPDRPRLDPAALHALAGRDGRPRRPRGDRRAGRRLRRAARGRQSTSAAENCTPGPSVDSDGVAAVCLGSVERVVGTGDEVVGVDLPRLGDGDADADRHRHPDRAALAHRDAQALGDLGRLLAAGAGQDDEDLLAADAVDRVAGAQRRAHHVGDVLEDGVAGGVSELVVDPLEVVEVAEQQRVREALLLVGGLPVELGEALLERVAVEEAGERVERRAAPVGAVGLDQGAGEDHRAEDQRHGRRSASGGARRRERGRAQRC